MKLWYKSKTIWFNALTGSLTAATLLLQYVDVIGLDVVTAGRAGLLLSLFLSGGNFVLRLVTKEAVGTSNKMAEQ